MKKRILYLKTMPICACDEEKIHDVDDINIIKTLLEFDDIEVVTVRISKYKKFKNKCKNKFGSKLIDLSEIIDLNEIRKKDKNFFKENLFKKINFSGIILSSGIFIAMREKIFKKSALRGFKKMSEISKNYQYIEKIINAYEDFEIENGRTPKIFLFINDIRSALNNFFFDEFFFLNEKNKSSIKYFSQFEGSIGYFISQVKDFKDDEKNNKDKIYGKIEKVKIDYFPIQEFGILHSKINKNYDYYFENGKKLPRKNNILIIQRDIKNHRKNFMEDFIETFKEKNYDIFGKTENEKILKTGRFFGLIPSEKYNEKISQYKFAVVPPFGCGFLTVKIYEYVINGIFPFVPMDYDTKNLSGLCIDEVRFKNMEDLKKKYEYYLTHNDERKEIIEYLQNKLPTKEKLKKYLKNYIINELNIINAKNEIKIKKQKRLF